MQWFNVRVDYRRTKRLRAIEACEVSKPDENGSNISLPESGIEHVCYVAEELDVDVIEEIVHR